jgi:predicted nucleotidyltransferase
MFRPDRPVGQPFDREGFERIGRALGVTELWAWGSRNRGDYVPDSDWDVVVQLKPGFDQVWARREAARVSEELGIKLDLFMVADPAPYIGAQHVVIGASS